MFLLASELFPDKKRMMTIRQQIEQDLQRLPEYALQEVRDFTLFLQSKYVPDQIVKRRNHRQTLLNEPFIGIWKHRDDMENSSEWVEKLRTAEWRHS